MQRIERAGRMHIALMCVFSRKPAEEMVQAKCMPCALVKDPMQPKPAKCILSRCAWRLRQRARRGAHRKMVMARQVSMMAWLMRALMRSTSASRSAPRNTCAHMHACRVSVLDKQRGSRPPLKVHAGHVCNLFGFVHPSLASHADFWQRFLMVQPEPGNKPCMCRCEGFRLDRSRLQLLSLAARRIPRHSDHNCTVPGIDGQQELCRTNVYCRLFMHALRWALGRFGRELGARRTFVSMKYRHSAAAKAKLPSTAMAILEVER